jgi:thiol-disulfide isomerase/thioredoxin
MRSFPFGSSSKLLLLHLITGTVFTLIAAEKGDNPKMPLFRLPNQTDRCSSNFIMADHVMPESSQVMIVTFFASWCAPCRQELPFLQRLADTYAAQGARLCVVCREEQFGKRQRAILFDTLCIHCPVVHDAYGILARRFGMGTGLPFTCYSNRKGQIVERRTGFTAKDTAAIREMVKALLKDPPRTVDTAGTAQ